MNIMVLETGAISGIVNWELSPPLQPFGMCCNRIHDIAGRYTNGEFNLRKEYQEMERGFWCEIMDAVPVGVRKALEKNLDAVQIRVITATVMDRPDTGGQISQVALKALPNLLTSCVPALGTICRLRTLLLAGGRNK